MNNSMVTTHGDVDLTALTVLQELGRNVRRLREDRGLSSQQLADAVGMTSDQIATLETGAQDFGIDTLDRLAVALSITHHALFRRNDDADERPRIPS